MSEDKGTTQEGQETETKVETPNGTQVEETTKPAEGDED